MWLPFFKTLHIVGFVAWFAGLFYLVRMFVYHVEALAKPEPERSILARQLSLMEWRAWRIICNPAMNLTWTFGTAMLFVHGREWFLANWWIHVKLVLLLLLTGYHEACKGIIKKLERGEQPFTSFQFRLLNEAPTLFLIGIVLLAVYRNTLNVGYALTGVAGFALLLVIFARLYRKARAKRDGKGT